MSQIHSKNLKTFQKKQIFPREIKTRIHPKKSIQFTQIFIEILSIFLNHKTNFQIKFRGNQISKKPLILQKNCYFLSNSSWMLYRVFCWIFPEIFFFGLFCSSVLECSIKRNVLKCMSCQRIGFNISCKPTLPSAPKNPSEIS
jgi:hypothetical protein